MSKKGETLVAVLTLACSFVVAQPVHRSDEVMGLSGAVRVLPNPNATHGSAGETGFSSLRNNRNRSVRRENASD